MQKKSIVLLINPFTSVAYILDYFHAKGIAVCAFYTNDQIRRSGYVQSELEKAVFDEVIYGNKNLEQDIALIEYKLYNYTLIYSLIGSELDDYAYSEQLTQRFFPQLANDPTNAHLRYDKYEMNEALKEQGLTHIKQTIADRYTAGYITGKSIVKPIKESCSERGVVYFDDEEALLTYLEHTENKSDLLVQELIEGDECVVDSFTYNNNHYLIYATKNGKINEGINIVTYSGTVGIESIQNELFNAAISCLDVLKVKNGFSHIEFIVNENGIYLLELNPRLPGLAGQLSDLSQICYQRHHLQALYDTVFCSQTMSTKPLFSGNFSVVFLLNNFSHAFDGINKTALEAVASYTKLKSIRSSGPKPIFISRLNTVAFILMNNNNEQLLKSDIQKIVDMEKSGEIFLQQETMAY